MFLCVFFEGILCGVALKENPRESEQDFQRCGADRTHSLRKLLIRTQASAKEPVLEMLANDSQHTVYSLPELPDFQHVKHSGKTILVVNKG